MSIIEKAARRLEELNRAGVKVPWSAAGLSDAQARSISEHAAAASSSADAATQASISRIVGGASAALPQLPSTSAHSVSKRRSREVSVDLAALTKDGYLVPGQQRSDLADEFRGIKRPLLRNVHGESTVPIRRANLILVTSALPGEGKTFCAINLALSVASEVDTSVLLVDCDVVRPSLLTRLGVHGDHPGILDLLTRDELDVSDALLRTNVPKLSVLPAGRPRPDSTELLASSAMERLLDDLSERYADRVIVFDAPPLLVTTESKVLASRMGQILVVVDETSSTPKQIAQVFAALDSMPVVMSVLNKSARRPSAPRYAYYEG